MSKIEELAETIANHTTNPIISYEMTEESIKFVKSYLIDFAKEIIAQCTSRAALQAVVEGL